MGLAERIHNTKKKIKKRMKIADGWRFDWGQGKGENQYKGEEGRLDKNNLNCGCKMCHYYKYDGSNKRRRRENKKIDEYEIQE